MAANTLRRLGPSTLPTTPAAQFAGFTVPTGRLLIVRNIHALAIADVTTTFTLSIGNDAAGTRWEDDCPVSKGSMYDWSGFMVLAAADFFQAYASVAASINLVISGVEMDVPA